MAYDPSFLGLTVPLPTHPSVELVLLDYEHFSVAQNTDRRLAAVTAVNIDGEQLVDLERGDDWHLDDRLPEEHQAGPDLYARNDLDRGHLVRRRDPVWGDAATAKRANYDSFAYTNAAPQASAFNQSKELWLGVEDYVLEHARATGRRLSVFSGPVFEEDDELYRGVRIPRRFFKIAAWNGEGELACTGYLLDQSAVLRTAVVERPELGPFRTFQLPVADVAELTGLDLGPLPGADRYAPPSALPGEPRWLELDSLARISL